MSGPDHVDFQQLGSRQLNAASDFLMLIVSSPSGAGKTTLCNRLRGDFPELAFSVSHTTRKPRPNEQDGREYHFIDQPRFEQMLSEGHFAEWARVHGHSYGTSLSEIDRAKDNGARGIIFDIDYQGARQITAHVPGAISVFILPPSLQELERRLRGRGTEDEAATVHRLANAKEEIEHYGLFDYIVVNADLDLAYAELSSIALAERCRRRRIALRCEALLAEAQAEKKG